jgi:hypothetical protein
MIVYHVAWSGSAGQSLVSSGPARVQRPRIGSGFIRAQQLCPVDRHRNGTLAVAARRRQGPNHWPCEGPRVRVAFWAEDLPRRRTFRVVSSSSQRSLST